MQSTKAFIFKERRLASLIWLWGVLGTLVVSFIVDYLTRIPFLSDIPGYGYVVVCFIPIYYFFTLHQSYRAYGSGLGAFISAFFQFIGQIAVLILIMSFWFIHMAFGTTDYQENTFDLMQGAPSFFTEESKLDYPTDAELIHTSQRKWGANFSKNIVFRVDDINAFHRKALEKYRFDNLVMDFPNIGRSRLGERNGNVFYPPFCMGVKTVDVKPRYFKKTREMTDPENFCGERDVLFTQIKRETEIGIIMVILPKEKLVWLNSTGWF